MILTILRIIVVLAAIIGILWAVHRNDELDDREDELKQNSLDLDERANRIAAEEETLKMEWAELRKAKEAIDNQREGKP